MVFVTNEIECTTYLTGHRIDINSDRSSDTHHNLRVTQKPQLVRQITPLDTQSVAKT